MLPGSTSLMGCANDAVAFSKADNCPDISDSICAARTFEDAFALLDQQYCPVDSSVLAVLSLPDSLTWVSIKLVRLTSFQT